MIQIKGCSSLEDEKYRSRDFYIMFHKKNTEIYLSNRQYHQDSFSK